MNITFLLKTLNLIGGLEIVTAVLANQFVKDGHNISFWVFEDLPNKLNIPLRSEIIISYGHGFEKNSLNVEDLSSFLSNQKTDIVINQWGLPYIPIWTLNNAIKKLKLIKNPAIISVYHSNPSSNGRIFNADKQYKEAILLLKPFFYTKKILYKFITSFSMRYVYESSDAYVVLSECYIPILKDFIFKDTICKCVSITNPLTINNKDFSYKSTEKDKIVLYVGRLEEVAKRTSRVISIWSLLEQENPDWELIMVGDGPDKDYYIEMVNHYRLRNVKFEGYRQPEDYYCRASILILTSEFEGFPLVLPECMGYGVVPIVYNSFPAVNDIIKDGINGYIEPCRDVFNEESMANTVSLLMRDDKKLKSLAEAAFQTSKNYDVKEIAKQWYSLFDKLNKLT